MDSSRTTMDSTRLIFPLSVVHVLLLLSFGAQSKLVCSHRPIVAFVGDDVVLPCRLEPPISAAPWRLEWSKPGLDPKYVHVHEDGRLQFKIQNPSYFVRTRVFVDELERGNVSLKIFSLKVSDEGKYSCHIDSVQEEASVHLIVGSVSSPVIQVTANSSRSVVLQCESKGWYPEPELLWLDAEGKLLSGGRTRTVRGPDVLYTVSSRVTVEKRHSNSFTCRVQQKITNQTRDAQIHVPGDLIKDTPEILHVIAVSVMLFLPAVLFVSMFCWCCFYICTKHRNEKYLNPQMNY